MAQIHSVEKEFLCRAQRNPQEHPESLVHFLGSIHKPGSCHRSHQALRDLTE